MAGQKRVFALDDPAIQIFTMHRMTPAAPVTCPGAYGSIEEAPAVVILGHFCPHALTIVGVGLAVAAAHREENAGTEPRYPRAGAGDVGDEASSGLSLAEQAMVTLLRVDDKTAALLADADRIGAGGKRNQQRQCRCK